MDRFGDVTNFATHFDRQDRLGDQFSSSGADQAAAEQAVVLGIDQPFRQTFSTSQRLGATAGCPRVNGHLILPALAFGLLFGQTGPSNFRVREDHRGDRHLVKFGRFAQQNLNRSLRFMRSFVSQHRLARDVSDHQNVLIRRLLSTVVSDKSPLIDLDLRVLQTQVSRIGAPPNRDEYAIKPLGTELARSLERDFHLVAHIRQGADFRIEINPLAKILQQFAMQRFHQVAIRSGQ